MVPGTHARTHAHTHTHTHTHPHTQLQRTVASHRVAVDELRARLLKERSQSETAKLSSQLVAKEVSHSTVVNWRQVSGVGGSTRSSPGSRQEVHCAISPTIDLGEI